MINIANYCLVFFFVKKSVFKTTITHIFVKFIFGENKKASFVLFKSRGKNFFVVIILACYESLIFQRLIYLIYVFEIKIIVLNIALKVKFAIIIEKSSLKAIIKLIIITKRGLLNENDRITTK